MLLVKQVRVEEFSKFPHLPAFYPYVFEMVIYKASPNHFSSSRQYIEFDISSKFRAKYVMQA